MDVRVRAEPLGLGADEGLDGDAVGAALVLCVGVVAVGVDGEQDLLGSVLVLEDLRVVREAADDGTGVAGIRHGDTPKMIQRCVCCIQLCVTTAPESALPIERAGRPLGTRTRDHDYSRFSTA